MPISHKYKCIFIHIPKAAGESIGYALNMIDAKTNVNVENRDSLYGWIDKSSSDLLAHGFLSGVLQHLTLRDLKKVLSPDIMNQYFKFAFVRNPWDRMVSYYHFTKIAFPAEYSQLSFIQFLNGLSPYLKQEQYDFIIDENGDPQVDFIGKLETVARDFKTVCKKINVPELKLPSKNATQHEHYSYYYTNETRELVAELFKNDIRVFGYKFKKPSLTYKMKNRLRDQFKL